MTGFCKNEDALKIYRKMEIIIPMSMDSDEHDGMMNMMMVETDREEVREVPYYPDMLACEYLKRVIVPAWMDSLNVSKDGLSVFENIVYYPPPPHYAVPFAFTYENRKVRIGDAIPPGAALEIVPPRPLLSRDTNNNTSMKKMMMGNAAMEDVRAPCAICLDDDFKTNYTLKGCFHRFHDVCIARSSLRKCPCCTMPGNQCICEDGGGEKKRFNARHCALCRKEYGEKELDAVNVSVIDGVHSGRLSFANGGVDGFPSPVCVTIIID